MQKSVGCPGYDGEALVLEFEDCGIPLNYHCNSVVTHMLDYAIIVSEIELQSRYYNHFRTNTLGKDGNFLIPLTYELN